MSINTYSQTPIPVKPKVYVDTLNRYYHNLRLPAYLYIATSPDSVPTPISTKDYSDRKNPLAPFYFNRHGKHYIKYSPGENQLTVDFVVYVDGLSPKTEAHFQEAQVHYHNEKVFYGPGLSVALSYEDDMAGMEKTYYSVNKGEYTLYDSTLTFDEEGEYSLQYFSTDNVGNQEKHHKKEFVVDIAAPTTYHNINGVSDGNTISSKTKIYLTYEDNLSGVAHTYYAFDDGAWIPYIKGTIPTGELKDGDHTLKYLSIDYVKNKEEVKVFDFYLDKTSPIMTSDILGDRFIVGDKVYFSSRTKLKLTAIDNKSGVKEVRYSIDGDKFKKYTDPVYMPSKAGNHTVRYFGTDNMSNEGTGGDDLTYGEYVHNTSVVYVDLSGPLMDNAFEGPVFKKGRTIYINKNTHIKLSATDAESGLQKITYYVNDSKEEINYSKSITLEKEGKITLQYFAYDNVNNRNTKKFNFIVDNDGPEIFYHFSISPNKTATGEEIYPSYSSFYLAATDDYIGNDIILYSINGAAYVPYKGAIKGFEKNKDYTISIKALDKLGNESVQDVAFKTDTY